MLLLDEYFNAGQEHCPTLWVGTNAGTVFIHQLTVPSSDKRSTEEVQCVLCTFYYFFSEFRLVIHTALCVPENSVLDYSYSSFLTQSFSNED